MYNVSQVLIQRNGEIDTYVGIHNFVKIPVNDVGH